MATIRGNAKVFWGDATTSSVEIGEVDSFSVEGIAEWVHVTRADPDRPSFRETIRIMLEPELMDSREPDDRFFSKPVEPLTRARHFGRNEPCYCGSGHKFKRCHGR